MPFLSASPQSIVKEKKIQRDYFKTQEALGKISAKPPPPKTMAKSAIDTVGVPEHVTQTMRDPVDGMTLATRWVWVEPAGWKRAPA